MSPYRDPAPPSPKPFVYLHQIPRESRVLCEVNDGSTYLTFHHLDGSFSVCTSENGNLCHLYVSSKLKYLIPGNYQLIDPDSVAV